MSVNHCHYCGVQQERLEREHVIPKYRGGGGGVNIVAACSVCNRDKGGSTAEEYRRRIQLTYALPSPPMFYFESGISWGGPMKTRAKKSRRFSESVQQYTKRPRQR
jgi:hypothetical protein